MRSFEKHTPAESIVQWIGIAVALAGAIIVVGFHHSWGYALIALAFLIGLPITLRVTKRKNGVGDPDA